MKICLNPSVFCVQNTNLKSEKKNKFQNLTPLKCDTVSFGTMKKNEFSGIDLVVVNKFKAPIEKFNSNEDLQTWCDEKLESEYLPNDYPGRDSRISVQRLSLLNTWHDLITGMYNGTTSLLIADSITKNLKPNNDKVPPVLKTSVVKDTINEINDRLSDNPQSSIDFRKLYKANLINEMVGTLLNNNGEKIEGNTGWVVIPSKLKDSQNFDKNVERLQCLSYKTWSTSQPLNALSYLSKGDFHIYLEKGIPKVGIKFIGDVIQEIQGELNNDKIPLEYLETVKEYTKNKRLSSRAIIEFERAESAKNKINELETKFGKPLNEISNVELFTAFDMLEKKDDDGLLILKSYGPPDKNLNWEDLGIKENKLFEEIKEIKGDADFSDSRVTNLGKLEKIGGNAEFGFSLIEHLGTLKEIGKSAFFLDSKVSDLGELKKIGADAFFAGSPITSLGKLEEIGKNAHFEASEITDLGSLKVVYGNVDIRYSKLTKNDFNNIKVKGEISD